MVNSRSHAEVRSDQGRNRALREFRYAYVNTATLEFKGWRPGRDLDSTFSKLHARTPNWLKWDSSMNSKGALSVSLWVAN